MDHPVHGLNSMSPPDVTYTLKPSTAQLSGRAGDRSSYRWSAAVHPIIQDGFAAGQIKADEWQGPQPWQLSLLEGVKVRDQTVYSQQRGDARRLYDSDSRYS